MQLLPRRASHKTDTAGERSQIAPLANLMRTSDIKGGILTDLPDSKSI